MLKWNNNVGKKNDNEPTDRLTVGLIAKKNSWHRRIPIFGLLELPYKLLILLVVALLLSSSFAVFYYTNWKMRNKVVIHIGDYKINKPEYNKLISQAKQLKISEYDAHKQIREALQCIARGDLGVLEVKSLKWKPGYIRVRVGNIRIICRLVGDKYEVLHITNRNEKIYRGI